MADHGQIEYGTATGNDLAAHEQTYDNFLHIATVGACHVASIVIALAIGGGTHRWGYSVMLLVLATLVASHGLLTGSRTPSFVMVVISLLTLAVAAS